MAGRKHPAGVSTTAQRIEETEGASWEAPIESRRGGVGVPTTYCAACRGLRAIRDWHEKNETLVIELEPCGHVVLRCAREEWIERKAVA
jgi:hypothetical protein